MKKILILPNNFKAKGLLLSMLGLAMMSITTQNGLINVIRLFSSGRIFSGLQPYPSWFWETNMMIEYFSMATVVVGMILFFLSKEADEFFYKVRLESIQWALCVQMIVASGLYVYCFLAGTYHMENTYLGIMFVSFISFWAGFVLRYYYVKFLCNQKADNV